MQYLVELRSDTGEREDYWPVDSYVLDGSALDAEQLANTVNETLTGTEHFVTITPVETVPVPAFARETLPSYIVDRSRETLRESGYLAEED